MLGLRGCLRVLSHCSTWGLFPSCSVGFPLRWLLSSWRPGSVALRHVESSWTRDWTCAPCIGRWVLYHWTTSRVLQYSYNLPFYCLFFQGNSLDLLVGSGSSASSFYLRFSDSEFRRSSCLLWSQSAVAMWECPLCSLYESSVLVWRLFLARTPAFSSVWTGTDPGVPACGDRSPAGCWVGPSPWSVVVIALSGAESAPQLLE